MTEETEQAADSSKKNANWLTKLAVLAVVAVAFAIAYSQFSLSGLAEREESLKAYRDQSPAVVYGVAFVVYTAVSGLSLPVAAPLTVAYGWFFGVGPGLVLVSFASTAGATIAFLLSRFLFRDAIERKFGDRLTKFNKALEKEGAFYLFTLRLIPAVPFFVINAVMGLTPIKTRTYWWVSQVGMLPGTAVFVYAGSSIPGLKDLAENGPGKILSPQILVAFVLLGLFPLVVKKTMGYFRKDSPVAVESSTDTNKS